MTKFSLISDLHVDHRQPEFPYHLLEENVIVAGDTANGLTGVEFLSELKRKGFNVFAIDGNHEHYANVGRGLSILETEGQFFRDLGQAHSCELGGLNIIGCNGWYPITDAARWRYYMSDGRCVGDESEVKIAAENHVRWLRICLEAHRGKSVIVTHTAPCPDTLNPAYDGHYSNEWFWNPEMLQILTDFSDKIAVWVHGHSHAQADKIVNGVRVVCNPRGYPHENPDWAPLTIEIGDQ